MRAALLALGACCLAQVAFAQAPRDSAGVTVRRYPRGARAPAQWSTEKKPLLSIGGAEGIGPTEFTGVQGAMRASNGLVAVADGGANELRVFDARGAFVRTIGRKGSGPGEFDRLITFVRSGDTMFVVDNSARLNVYTSTEHSFASDRDRSSPT
ncbi:MAG: 6-bladed beta-propeller [Cytophagaceae bacterium]|nr:6-bladed beta-propeller [Gemmatimonadaceae bacterium]